MADELKQEPVRNALDQPKVKTRRKSALDSKEYKDLKKRADTVEALLRRLLDEAVPAKYKSGRMPGPVTELVSEVKSTLSD